MSDLNACPTCGAHVPDVMPLHSAPSTPSALVAPSISEAECGCGALLTRSVTLATAWAIDPRRTRMRRYARMSAGRRAA